MHAHSQTHQPHTRPSPPEGPPGMDCVFQKAPRGPGRRGGHRACPEATLPSGVPHPGGVWGGKVARPPGEAVVAGALARAHALERHPGSSGGVPCRQSTNMGLQTVAQALLVGEAAPPGGAGLLWKAWLHHQLQQGWVPAVQAPSPPACARCGQAGGKEEARDGGQELVLSSTLLQGLALGKSPPALPPAPPTSALLFPGVQGPNAPGAKAGPASGRFLPG